MSSPLALAGVGAGPSNIVLLDYFVDTNGTLLSSHTMNVGPGWNAPGDGVIQIENNSAQSTTHPTNTDGVYWADARHSDVTVTCTLSASDGESINGRYSDDNNFWIGRLYHGNLQIYEVNGGVVTLRAQTADSDGNPYTLQMQFRGQTITLTEGSYQAQYGSAANNQSNTHFGFNATNVGETYHNFKATAP